MLFRKGYQIFESFVVPSRLDVFSSALDNSFVTCYGNKNFFKVNDPYLVCPEIIDIALSDEVKKLATMFLGSQWGLGTCNLRRSILTKQVDRSTTMFHRDNNSRKIIKNFFYLNDVDINGGPFTYVEAVISIGARVGGPQEAAGLMRQLFPYMEMTELST